jgi:hypothetical protein
MRILSTLAKFLAVMAATILVIYLLANTAAVAVGFVKRQQVAGEVTSVLARTLPSAERSQDELVDSVGREPDRRWIEQACDFRSVDSGWIAVSHREICVLRSVTAWRVGSEQEAVGLVPLIGPPGTSWDGCSGLGVVGPPGVVDGPEATYVDPAGADDGEPWCVYGLGTDGAARGLAGERAGLGEERWLLLVAEQPLVDEDIGCARWSVLFCDNPWTGHAFGEAPQD